MEHAEKKVKNVNINAIGKASSGRLASTLSADLADEICKEKGLNGDYDDFEDLQRRVRGLGPKKIEKLREAGFVVDRRGGGGVGGGGGGCGGGGGEREEKERVAAARPPVDDAAADVNFPELRSDVNSFKAQTWRHRDDCCLYTLLKQRELKKQGIVEEVDHVLECQLLNYANEKLGESMGSAYRTRGSQDHLRALFNNVSNLNVTTHEVNQKKKGPFTIWVHEKKALGGSARQLEDILSDSKARSLRDDGTWARITSSMVLAHGELEVDVGNIRAKAQQDQASNILEELKDMMSQMGI